MKTKLDLVGLGRVVQEAEDAYNAKAKSGISTNAWSDGEQFISDRHIYIGGHVADYVEAKLNERAAARIVELDSEVERLKAEGYISDSPRAWILKKTDVLSALQKTRGSQGYPYWWDLALVAVGALVQLAYNTAVYANGIGLDALTKIKAPAVPLDSVLIDALFAIRNRAANYQFLNNTNAQNELFLSDIQLTVQNALDAYYYKQATK